MSGPALGLNGSTPGGESPYQQQLMAFCRDNGLRQPEFQVFSDRRGGRTAWSSAVIIHNQTIRARFFYDGKYVNSAREDAAEVALQQLRAIPPSAQVQLQRTQRVVQQ